MFFESANGAVSDVAETATAFPHRKAIANMMLFGLWKDPSQDEPGRKAIRATWSKLAPFTEGYYTNLVDTEPKGTDNNYGANFTRLTTLKKKFDPLNLFRLNPQGSRQGKILLIERFGITDASARYTIKRYTSRKRSTGEDQWEHEQIRLEPLNPEYEAWNVEPDGFAVVAEWLRVIE